MNALATAAGVVDAAPPGGTGRPQRDPAEGRRPRDAGRAVLLALVIAFALFSASRMVPPQPYGLAVDWRVFCAAAAVVAEGGSPYDPVALHAAEQRADHYDSVQPAIDDFANPAPVAWVLQPLAALPFWVSYALVAALGLAAAAAALLAWLRRQGWRRPFVWTALALLSWPSLVGLFSGQFDLLLLAAMVGAMALAIRGRPALAGSLCAAAAAVKPHILWPLPLLITAAQLPDRRAGRRCAIAALATAAAVVAAGEVLMPGSTAAFVVHLLGFGSHVSSAQPDLAGLSGLLAPLAGAGVLAAVVAACGAAATVAFAVHWALAPGARALPAPRRTMLGVCAGLAIWLVAAPYAHPNDDVLLIPLLALVLGRDAADRGRLATASLAALAILPMAWPFHVLPVSLTPLAVLLVATAGIRLVRRTLGSERDVPVLARRGGDLLAHRHVQGLDQ